MKDKIVTCSCNEAIVVKEGNELILKSRIMKVVEGLGWVKCRRCRRWMVAFIAVLGSVKEGIDKIPL